MLAKNKVICATAFETMEYALLDRDVSSHHATSVVMVGEDAATTTVVEAEADMAKDEDNEETTVDMGVDVDVDVGVDVIKDADVDVTVKDTMEYVTGDNKDKMKKKNTFLISASLNRHYFLALLPLKRRWRWV